MTWSTDHRSTTRWVLDLLSSLEGAMNAALGKRTANYDVFGLSRGHCAIMNAFEMESYECESEEGKGKFK